MTDLPTVHLGLQLEVGTFQREHNAGCTATRCLRTYSSRDVDEEKKRLFWTFKAKMLVLFKILYPPVFWWEAHRFKTGENICVQHLPQFIIRTYASITYWERNIKLHWLCRNVLLLITLLGKKLCSWTRNPVFCWVSFLFFFCYDPWKHASMIKYFSPDVFGKLLPVSGKHYSLICTLGQLVIMLHDILSR